MIVYRITKCKYADDLSGEGASKFGGRWNSKGTKLVYTSSSISLANLEFLVNTDGLPLKSNICILHIEVPDQSIYKCNIDQLPTNWIMALTQTKLIGDEFIKNSKYLLYSVPSSVINEENNVLINPFHPLAKKIKIIIKKPFDFDRRLL